VGSLLLSTRPSLTELSWEHVFYPTYFVPITDVDEGYFEHSGGDDEKDTYDIILGDRRSIAAAWLHKQGNLKGWLKIAFDKVDHWFEEDEEIFVHPKDPYKVRRACVEMPMARNSTCVSARRCPAKLP
jgi:hypothetical protein